MLSNSLAHRDHDWIRNVDRADVTGSPEIDASQ